MTPDQPVNARTLAANQRKQNAYALGRRLWTGRLLGRQAPQDPDAAVQPGEPARPGRGSRTVIHDKRQSRLDL